MDHLLTGCCWGDPGSHGTKKERAVMNSLGQSGLRNLKAPQYLSHFFPFLPGMPFSEPMEVTPSVPELQPDTPAPTAAPASQPPAPAPPTPLAAASMSHAVVKEKVGSTSTSGGVRVAKDSRHLEQALGSVDLEETLSPGQYLCVCAWVTVCVWVDVVTVCVWVDAVTVCVWADAMCFFVLVGTCGPQPNPMLHIASVQF